jgi:hypothetical protein
MSSLEGLRKIRIACVLAEGSWIPIYCMTPQPACSRLFLIMEDIRRSGTSTYTVSSSFSVPCERSPVTNLNYNFPPFKSLCSLMVNSPFPIQTLNAVFIVQHSVLLLTNFLCHYYNPRLLSEIITYSVSHSFKHYLNNGPLHVSNTVTCTSQNEQLRFEVFTVVTMKIAIFWDVTPHGSCKNRGFGGM